MGEIVTILYSGIGEAANLALTSYKNTIGTRQLIGQKAKIITHITNASGVIANVTITVYALVGGRRRFVAQHVFSSFSADTSSETIVEVCQANLAVETATNLAGETYDLDVQVVRI